MKVFIGSCILFLFFNISNAQTTIDYGVKFGLNYSSHGSLDITGGFIPFSNTIESNRQFGFEVGGFAQTLINNFSLRTEILFQQSESTYDGLDYRITSLNLPLLLGYKIVKPITIYLGSSVKYDLKGRFINSFDNGDFDLDKKVILVANVGISARINKFEIDLRYSGEASNSKATNFRALASDGPGYIIDSKSNQMILSLAYSLN